MTLSYYEYVLLANNQIYRNDLLVDMNRAEQNNIYRRFAHMGMDFGFAKLPYDIKQINVVFELGEKNND